MTGIDDGPSTYSEAAIFRGRRLEDIEEYMDAMLDGSEQLAATDVSLDFRLANLMYMLYVLRSAWSQSGV